MVLPRGICAVFLIAVGCAQGVPRQGPPRRTLFPGEGTRSGAPAVGEVVPGSLSLAQAFRLAVDNSERIAIAGVAVREAETRARDRWSDVTPSITATASAGLNRERTVGMQVLTPGEQLVVGAELQQPVFRRGFFSSRAAGRRAVESTAALEGRERQALARDVAEVFIGVIRSRKLVEQARTAVTRAKAQHDYAQARVKAGGALKSAEMLALLDLRRAERLEVTARGELGLAEATFKRLIGIDAPAKLEVPAIPNLPAADRSTALAAKRLDVKALELRVAEAQAEQDAAEGRRWWPRLDVLGSVSYSQPEVLERTTDWRVLGLLTIPLLQSGREFTDIALREHAARTAQLRLVEQREVVSEEVRLASVRVATAEQATELASQQLETARDHYKLVDKQFRLGAITFLEVTNAQAVLVEAENAFEVASMDRLQAAYDYLFAIGALEL
jgi:outer membrane protein